MAADPHLLALATAVPSFVMRQDDIAALAPRLFDRSLSEIDRLLPTYDNAGIATRYSCMPLDWYLEPHGWKERSALFRGHGVALMAEAAGRCLERAGIGASEVDALIAVSTTGIATPSLDALLMERLPFRRNLVRLPIFGLGCAGGVLGLARGAALARAEPGSRVLVLVTELCALTFRHGDNSKSNVIASALFGDGAAAALVSTAGDGPCFGPGGEHTWSDTLEIMGWHIEEDGLGVLFSRDIPAFVRSRLREATDAFLDRHGLSLQDIDRFCCHPGGAKVLDALEASFGLAPDAMTEARQVLRDYGNMSAATVLFVLERMLLDSRRGRFLLSSLGPGFTAAFQLLGSA